MTCDDIIVRNAEPADIPKISRLIASSWKFAYRGIIDREYLESLSGAHWESVLESGLRDDAVSLIVAADSGVIVGEALVRAGGNKGQAELTSFYLLPERIATGVGHTFYTALEKIIISRGIYSIVLDVLATNSRTIRFYTAHGFTDDEKDFLVTLGGKDYLCKEMSKTLNRGYR